MPQGKSIIFGRSHCDHCRKQLGWDELVPLVSYFIQGGRCRYCKKHLSAYYPVIEALTGCIFLCSGFFLFGTDTSLLYAWINFAGFVYVLFIFSCLMAIFFIDYKYGIIPFKLVFLTIGGACVWYATVWAAGRYGILPGPGLDPLQTQGFWNYLFSSVGVFGFFFLLFICTKGRGMGFGDVVYALLMGFLLGFPRVIIGLYVAFLTGAVISLILVLIGKKRLKGGTIPFGPFLVGGTLVGFFWGQFIINIAFSYLH
jgi:prepilin signal peptidase PulO-like enzyme (type II secretory pathway)